MPPTQLCCFSAAHANDMQMHWGKTFPGSPVLSTVSVFWFNPRCTMLFSPGSWLTLPSNTTFMHNQVPANILPNGLLHFTWSETFELIPTQFYWIPKIKLAYEGHSIPHSVVSNSHFCCLCLKWQIWWISQLFSKGVKTVTANPCHRPLNISKLVPERAVCLQGHKTLCRTKTSLLSDTDAHTSDPLTLIPNPLTFHNLFWLARVHLSPTIQLKSMYIYTQLIGRSFKTVWICQTLSNTSFSKYPGMHDSTMKLFNWWQRSKCWLWVWILVILPIDSDSYQFPVSVSVR